MQTPIALIIFNCFNQSKLSIVICVHFVHYALGNGVDVVDGLQLLKLIILFKVFMVSKTAAQDAQDVQGLEGNKSV